MDKVTVTGFLEVTRNKENEIIINHPDLKPDADGVGHIVFSIQEARELASLLLHHAHAAERERLEKIFKTVERIQGL